MRTGWIYAGALLGCTPHPQELAEPELAPATPTPEVPTPFVSEAPVDLEPEIPPPPNDELEPPTINQPFPEVFCAYPDEDAGRWRIHIDPTERGDQRSAERLAERYPNANGIDGALARTNLPTRWRDVDEVTLVRTDAVEKTSVRAAGVYASASGGAFTFVLRSSVSGTASGRALALDGHVSPTPDRLRSVSPTRIDEARWSTVGRSVRDHARRGLGSSTRPGILARHVRWIAADLGGGIEGLMFHTARRRPGEFPTFAVIAASDGSADAVPVPIYAGGTSSGAHGVTDEAYYEPLALSDLDRDGHDEVLVRENWYEGSYDWLVRYDADEGLVATLLCGDAY